LIYLFNKNESTDLGMIDEIKRKYISFVDLSSHTNDKYQGIEEFFFTDDWIPYFAENAQSPYSVSYQVH